MLSRLLERGAYDYHDVVLGYSPVVGAAALERFYRETRVIKSGVHRLSVIVGSGDQVAVRSGFTGLLKDGASTQVDFADFFVLDPAGRMRERHTFFCVAAV